MTSDINTEIPSKRKTETTTIRFNKKQRYLTELAARAERRSISNFIEAVAEKSLMTVQLIERAKRKNDPDKTLGELADFLYEGDDVERLVKLGVYYPYLLSREEQDIWGVIVANNFVPESNYKSNTHPENIYLEMKTKGYVQHIRKNFSVICSNALGGKLAIPLLEEKRTNND